MNATVYQARAMGFMNPDVPENGPAELLVNAALGLCGEAGEFADLVKKHRHQGHPLDRERLSRELGDIAWYLAAGCLALDLDLSAVLRANLAKLEARYPGGTFSTAASVHRADEQRGAV